MKIGGDFPGFSVSAKGLSIQRKKMNLIAENIANADITRTANGGPYKRKFLVVRQKQSPFSNVLSNSENTLRLNVTDPNHFSSAQEVPSNFNNQIGNGLVSQEETDDSVGQIVYAPDNPDANSKGYVEQSNVNIITEMVDMIAASRSYEANLTALNSSKQMVKDSLDI